MFSLLHKSMLRMLIFSKYLPHYVKLFNFKTVRWRMWQKTVTVFVYQHYILLLTKCVYQAIICKTHKMITATCNFYNEIILHDLRWFFQLAMARQNANRSTGILPTWLRQEIFTNHASKQYFSTIMIIQSCHRAD